MHDAPQRRVAVLQKHSLTAAYMTTRPMTRTRELGQGESGDRQPC